MNKKYITLGLLIIIVAVGGVVFAMNRSDKPTPSNTTINEKDIAKQLELKFSDLQASYPPNPDTCLAISDDPNLKLDEADISYETGITGAVVNTIIDVPAGTNVDVHVKTYDKTVATGTSIYESTYGSYNFIAQKVKTDSNSDKESWVVSKFVACKK